MAPFNNRSFTFMFSGRPTLGVTGEELTSQLAGYFGVKQGKGRSGQRGGGR